MLRLLEALPEDRRHAFEFRHESWFDEEIYELLREHGAALVIEGGPPVAYATALGFLSTFMIAAA